MVRLEELCIDRVVVGGVKVLVVGDEMEKNSSRLWREEENERERLGCLLWGWVRDFLNFVTAGHSFVWGAWRRLPWRDVFHVLQAVFFRHVPCRPADNRSSCNYPCRSNPDLRC